MEKDILWTVVDPGYETSVWFANSLSGLREATGRLRMDLRLFPHVRKLPRQAEDDVVVVISDKREWSQFTVDELRRRGAKPILVGAAPDDFGDDVSGIILDRQAHVAHMVQYFADAGRRRLASVGNEVNDINDLIRQRAFLRAAQGLGLRAAESDVYPMTTGLDDCIGHFLDRAAQYDGAICVNDYVAVALLSEARRRGVRVPDDLFVSGSGNMIMGNCTSPTLTTATLNYREMGVQTVSLWNYLRKNPIVSALRVMIPCELICRESTASLPPRPYQREGGVPVHPAGTSIWATLLELQNLENCLIHCDAIDFGIICGVVEGLSSERIAERLFTAPGTVQYRLKKMYRSAGLRSRVDFEKLLGQHITNVDFLHRACQSGGERR